MGHVQVSDLEQEAIHCVLTSSTVPCSYMLKVAVPSEPTVSPSEVDKVLSGLEILSKVFDQQSSPMVTRLLQQQVGL